VSRRDAILREMGLTPLWRLRAGEAAELPERASLAEPPPDPQSVPLSAAAAAQPSTVAELGWDDLIARIQACTACRLCEQRKQAVPGVGDRQADWLFVGEGPGAEEDAQGEPFVGQAGRLLDNMLAAIGLARGKRVYIANAVKCRPPHNRTPEPDEIAACHPYLARQISLLAPRLIVALGRPAAQALLDTEVKIGAARGQIFRYAGIPVIVTYHPAYLLRNPNDKAKAWEDLCFARRTMARLVAEPPQA
jgi:uracil-DNA glycosylase family 4